MATIHNCRIKRRYNPAPHEHLIGVLIGDVFLSIDHYYATQLVDSPKMIPVYRIRSTEHAVIPKIKLTHLQHKLKKETTR